jgi:hypothetical protein
MSKTKTSNVETQPVATAPVVPVDPSAVLAARRKQKRAEAWAPARELLVKQELSERDVLTLADLLEQAGLQAEWIGPFRATLALHATESAARDAAVKSADAESVQELGCQVQAARDAYTARQEAVRRQIKELESELQVLGAPATAESRELTRLGRAHATALAAENAAATLSKMWRPLFDESATVDDFGLLSADQLPAPIAAALQAAGLIRDGQPVALTAPPPPPAIRQPIVRPVPVLACSHGPRMELYRQ